MKKLLSFASILCLIIGIILIAVGIFFWITVKSDVSEIKTFSPEYWKVVHTYDTYRDKDGLTRYTYEEEHDIKVCKGDMSIALHSSTLDEYADNMYDFGMKKLNVVPISCGGIALIIVGIAVIFLNKKNKES